MRRLASCLGVHGVIFFSATFEIVPTCLENLVVDFYWQ